MFQLNAQFIIRVKVKEVRTNVGLPSRPYTSRWHLQKSASTKMEEWKSLVAGPLSWGGREGGAILTDLWPPMTCILS